MLYGPSKEVAGEQVNKHFLSSHLSTQRSPQSGLVEALFLPCGFFGTSLSTRYLTTVTNQSRETRRVQERVRIRQGAQNLV